MLLLKSLILSSFVSIQLPIPVYSECCPGQSLLVCRPFLLRHYPVSAVLWRHPTPMLSFDFLRLLRCRSYSFRRRSWVSRVATHTLYIMPGSSTPERHSFASHLQMSVLPSGLSKPSARIVFTHFEAQSHSGLMPTCQRLRLPITGQPPWLATSGMAVPYRTGVPPANVGNLARSLRKLRSWLITRKHNSCMTN